MKKMYEYNDSRGKLSTEIKSSKLLKIITKASSCEQREEAQKTHKKKRIKISRRLSALSDF